MSTDEPRANIIQHFEPDGRMWYECGWHHLPMPDNRCPKCDTYPTYEAMRADLPTSAEVPPPDEEALPISDERAQPPWPTE